MPKPKIVFMGTPDFAVPSLKILIEGHYPIVAVITQPDRPKGRGRILSPSPVKIAADADRLNILQPEKIRDREFIERLLNISPDLIVVAAFGQILPIEILQCAPMGCINIHPSLLPKYRGAAPMNWTLIRGETKTGVTIMLMDEGLDTGDILTQEETLIEPAETFGLLHDRLSKLGAGLLLKTIKMMEEGSARRIPQDESKATYAPKLKKEDGHIHWDGNAHEIVNLIKGLSPVPCAYTFFSGKILKIFSAEGEVTPVTEPPGQVGSLTEKGLPVAAKNGYVYLKDVQLEGKKRMAVHDLLRGFRILPGDILG